ncbi:hypothetical protein AB0M92_32435 [Streptomyces sp. NPDC051582]|uniref:hypothetical protein n=1 Tax=Streptomyces sp. NPDC051582 TaxID=3155167 RepID=UPI00343C1F97
MTYSAARYAPIAFVSRITKRITMHSFTVRITLLVSGLAAAVALIIGHSAVGDTPSDRVVADNGWSAPVPQVTLDNGWS